VPPKGYRKPTTPDDTPELLFAAMLLVKTLRKRDPQSMYLTMAESGLEQAQRTGAAPEGATDK
jgi:hypothetical protein